MIQDVYATDELNFNSTEADISNALSNAAYQLSSFGYPIECYHFLVSKAVTYDHGSSVLELNITFQADLPLWTNNPFTTITAVTSDGTSKI